MEVLLYQLTMLVDASCFSMFQLDAQTVEVLWVPSFLMIHNPM